jgi:6-phosphogluconolactonase
MKANLEILVNREALLERSLAIITSKIDEAIAARGKATLALAGGNTPKPIYEALSQCSLAWEQIDIFWGDERYVPANHLDSNQNMARLAWLDRVPFPAANIHGMPTGANDPQIDAQHYETEIKQFFQLESGQFPNFDLILLGMGDDGHTASLFPHTEALQERDRIVTVGNKDGQPRLTLTIPAINAAKCVLFVVTGANKQPALEQVFAPDGDNLQYPSRSIEPAGELWWLLDREAGEKIAKTQQLAYG